MSKQMVVRVLKHFVWSIIGGFIALGLSSCVTLAYELKAQANFNLFRILCAAAFLPYFYKFHCSVRMEIKQVVLGLLRNAVGCWLFATLFLMVLFNNFSMPIETLSMGYGLDFVSIISISYLLAYGLFLIKPDGEQKNLAIQASSVDGVKKRYVKMDEKEQERQVFRELLELINRNRAVNNIFKSCAVVWLFTWFIAYGAVVLTNADFMQLGAVLNVPTASDRENFLASTIVNVGLNFHVMSGLPSAIYFISRTYKVKKVLNSFREEEIAFKSIEQQQNGGIVSE